MSINFRATAAFYLFISSPATSFGLTNDHVIYRFKTSEFLIIWNLVDVKQTQVTAG
jgi:hypothetical protein